MKPYVPTLPPNPKEADSLMFTLRTALDHAQIALRIISETPRLDAELLLARALNRERSHLHAHLEAVLNEAQCRLFDQLVQRRAQGEPLAYILGFKEFWSLNLRVTPDVLIPRPETELLVELALAQIPERETWQIADLGTGSGAIAIALASERPRSQLIATDICVTALEVAKENARRLAVTNIRFLAGDWFAPLRERFHLIVSNPPYVDADDPHLRDPALRFEPRQALVSTASGLHDVAMLVRGASAYLYPDGWVMLEHGFEQGAAVRDMFARYGLREITTAHDLAGHERVTQGQHSELT